MNPPTLLKNFKMKRNKELSIKNLINYLIINLRIGWAIILTIYILVVFAMLVEIQFSHNRDTETWSKLFIKQLDTYSGIAKKPLKEAGVLASSVFRINRDEDIVEASNKPLVGFNISNSGLFKKISILELGDEFIILDSGIIENKLKAYYIVRMEDYFTVLNFHPDDFFPLFSTNTVFLFLDNTDIVIFSTDRSFIGEKVEKKIFQFRKGRIFLYNNIELNKNNTGKLSILRDVSVQLYLILIVGIVFIIVLIFLSGHLNIIKTGFNQLESESSELNLLVENLSGISSNDENNDPDTVQSYKNLLIDFHNKIKDNQLNYKENRETLDRYKNLTKTVVNLLDNTDLILKNLKEAENKYRSILENTQEGIFQVDLSTKIITANKPFSDLLGYRDVDELIKTINNSEKTIIASEEARIYFFDTLKTEQSIHQFHSVLNTRTNTKIHAVISARIVKDSKGKSLYIQGSVRDLTAEQTAISMKEEKDKALAISKAKSNFLANISHELRTPLNSVIGFSELLSVTLKETKSKAYVESILNAGRSLLMIITDILDLSKIDANKMDIIKSRVCLVRLYQEMEQLFSLQILRKNLILEFSVDEKLPSCVFIDETRIRQILMNLIGNAIKFTDEGSIKITTSFVKNESENANLIDLKISVKDTGRGISRKNLNSIFDEFKQDGTQSGISGTGLGLAICKRLTNVMNGQISVESELNKGSEFILLFKDLESDDSNVNEALNNEDQFIL